MGAFRILNCRRRGHQGLVARIDRNGGGTRWRWTLYSLPEGARELLRRDQNCIITSAMSDISNSLLFCGEFAGISARFA